MYNGKIIRDLIKKKKVKQNVFLEAVGWSGVSQLNQVENGNPTVSTLEPIADYFGVSMDVFFERAIPFDSKMNHVMGDGNNVNSVVFGNDLLSERVQSLELLLEEKDKRIEVLEEMNKMLRQEIDRINSKQG